MPEVVASQSAAPAAAEAEEVVGKKAGKRSLKKKVNPTEFGAPQKAASGYFLYMNEERADVLADLKAKATEENKFKIADVGRTLAAKWSALSQEDKDKWNTLAKEAKKKYEEEMTAWKLTPQYKEFQKEQASHKQKQQAGKATQAAKASGMPVRPVSAFFLFQSEVAPAIREQLKAEGKKQGLADVSAIVKPKWEALGVEGQKKYQDQFTQKTEAYKAELEKWNDSEEGKAYRAAIEKSRNEKKKSMDEAKGVMKRAGKRSAPADGDVDSSKRQKKGVADASSSSGAVSSTASSGAVEAEEVGEEEDEEASPEEEEEEEEVEENDEC